MRGWRHFDGMGDTCNKPWKGHCNTSADCCDGSVCCNRAKGKLYYNMCLPRHTLPDGSGYYCPEGWIQFAGHGGVWKQNTEVIEYVPPPPIAAPFVPVEEIVETEVTEVMEEVAEVPSEPVTEIAEITEVLTEELDICEKTGQTFNGKAACKLARTVEMTPDLPDRNETTQYSCCLLNDDNTFASCDAYEGIDWCAQGCPNLPAHCAASALPSTTCSYGWDIAKCPDDTW